MSLGDWLRRTLGLEFDSPVRPRAEGPEHEWLAAFEAGRLEPPRDVHDPAAWDEYWDNHLRVGNVVQSLTDQMSSDPRLPGLLSGRGVRTILCVGNGASMEALSLAVLGFDVTSLDISKIPAAAFARMLEAAEHPICQIPGLRRTDDGAVAFGPAESVPENACPPMHRGGDYSPRGAGRLSFVTGDLVDPHICVGPYDAIIERRTLQLFPETERWDALDRLNSRLASSGTLVSHQHEGRWRLGDDRVHFAERWTRTRGFAVRFDLGPDDSPSARRLACLIFSSG